MHRSFKSRLEALERLEGLHEPHPGELTVEDCAIIVGQMGLGNVLLDAHGRAVRQWECQGQEFTAQLDLALRRCNTMLAAHPEPPATRSHLFYGLVAYVPDDALPEWLWDRLSKVFSGDADEPNV